VRRTGRGGDGLDAAALVEVRAALMAGAAPSGALTAGAGEALPGVARALRLGTPLSRVAAEGLGGAQRRAQLLVRALAVAETAGAGAVEAVDQAARSAREEREIARLLSARTAQARGTAVLLTLMPAALALLLTLVGADPLTYYATPIGWATGSVAVALAAGGLWCARRLIAHAEGAPRRADPLMAPARPRQPWRVALLVPPAVVLGAAVGGMAAAVAAAVAAGAVALRRPRRPVARGAGAPADGGGPSASGLPSAGSPSAELSRDDGGAAETVDLVAVGLRAGLAPIGALETAAAFAPAAGREPLTGAARRMRAGRGVDEALAHTGLAELGRVLAATDRWGAPADAALAGLADELRAQRRAAAEIAAERAQLALVFPTTLLTLPAFALAVVPPLVARAFAEGFLAPL
jgi:Flp pilus assembly protein TadB